MITRKIIKVTNVLLLKIKILAMTNHLTLSIAIEIIVYLFQNITQNNFTSQFQLYKIVEMI